MSMKKHHNGFDRYLTENDLDDQAFADLLNKIAKRKRKNIQRDRTTVNRWRNGKRKPDWDSLELIGLATDGAITSNDFADGS